MSSPNREQLDQIVGHITHAIENPDTEFHMRVGSILINPHNYHFGDNVNMYGGTGNVGMTKA